MLYFVICFSIYSNDNIAISLLHFENRIYNDILIFNITNSYKLLVIQMPLFYQYVINTYDFFKFFIKLDSYIPYYKQKKIVIMKRI